MTSSPVIDVRPQRRLGLGRTAQLCAKGIKHRLFRSFLTFLVIVLAVAFFMFLLTGSINARAVQGAVSQEQLSMRRAPTALDQWFGRPSERIMAARLARDPSYALLVASVTRLPPEEVAVTAQACLREAQVLAWFDDLDAGLRAALVGRARGPAILAVIADPVRGSEAGTTASAIRSLRLPLPWTEMEAVARAAPSTAAAVTRTVEAWTAAVVRLDQRLVPWGAPAGDRLAWLAQSPVATRDGLFQALQAEGFGESWDRPAFDAVLSALESMALRERVVAALGTEEVRKAWKASFLTAMPLEEMLVRLDDPRAAQVLNPWGFSAVDLAEVSVTVRAERRLTLLDERLQGVVDPHGAVIGQRQMFLVVISFIVCMVGIANAMLMAITERFREIATMKCLGATDGFILTQFLMESGLQGIAGGILGMLLGLLLALIKDSASFGGHLWASLPVADLAVCGLGCIVAGVVLATLASIYPSWLASRMAPMDAMRLE